MAKTNRKVVSVSSREATLKRKIRRHLSELGFARSEDGSLQADGNTKDAIRALHRSQREDLIELSQGFLISRSPKLLTYFASGSEIDPAKICPVLERIYAHTWQGDLFRLASLTWSVPVSNGFGRRLRYLVWDQQNDKLMGIIAIGDPVFNLSVRDKLICWNSRDRGKRLVNMMDAYVLGSVPPYNALLGGKLIACLLRSRDIYNDFARTYGGTTGIISGQKKKARLLAVTTSSSMGRSSVYNRLRLDGIQYLKQIGYTSGWGHFHIHDKLYEELRDYLRVIGHHYADSHGYGEGPNWRFRTTRTALEALGFKDDMLRHGIRREVFLCELAANATALLRTGKGRPDLSSLLNARDVARLAIERWILPRAASRREYRYWKAEKLMQLLAKDQKTPPRLRRTG
jgi:hypothetical protein